MRGGSVRVRVVFWVLAWAASLEEFEGSEGFVGFRADWLAGDLLAGDLLAGDLLAGGLLVGEILGGGGRSRSG